MSIANTSNIADSIIGIFVTLADKCLSILRVSLSSSVQSVAIIAAVLAALFLCYWLITHFGSVASFILGTLGIALTGGALYMWYRILF